MKTIITIFVLLLLASCGKLEEQQDWANGVWRRVELVENYSSNKKIFLPASPYTRTKVTFTMDTPIVAFPVSDCMSKGRIYWKEGKFRWFMHYNHIFDLSCSLSKDNKTLSVSFDVSGTESDYYEAIFAIHY